MRYIDLKVWKKLSVVFGIFLTVFVSLTVWEYINLIDINSTFAFRLLLYNSIAAAFFLLIFSVLVLLVRKSFASTLKAAERLSKGDLTFEFEAAKRKDELGMIEAYLVVLKGRLSGIIEHVRETTANLIAASSELNSGSQLISTGANDQAAASTEISMTIDQVAMISKQTTENASETNSIAKMAYEGIIKGAKDLSEALSVIEEIAQKNSIISEISYQTKILSINASVEAARSSEFGKGFSVIAEHIKRLAETTQVSASEIEEVSKKGVKITRESAKMLEELVEKFHKTAELTQMVADSGAEQYSAIDQINLSMQELNNITQQNASSSEELTASSEELVKLSESLSEQIKFFKLTHEDLGADNNVDGKIDHSAVGYSETPNINNTEQSSFSFPSTPQEEDSDYSKKLRERINKRMEEFSNSSQFEPVSNLGKDTVLDLEDMPEEVKKKVNARKPIYNNDNGKSSSFNDTTNFQHGGVKINLSDNDDFDSQFERIK